MFFEVVGFKQVPSSARGKVFLVDDNWDDWASFRTQFQLVVYDQEGNRFEPGSLKIGEFGLKPRSALEELAPGFRAPTFDKEFDALDDRYFSLGQNENYYETLNNLPDDFRLTILKGLRDCALDIKLFNRALKEPVMQESLLRGISSENVRNRADIEPSWR